MPSGWIQLMFSFLCLLGMLSCDSVLQSGLDEREANEFILLLAEQGIPAQKKAGSGSDGNWTVSVPRTDISRAWRSLRVAGLPRLRHDGFQSVYRERGLIPGRLEEQALFLSALQEEIAETLESVEGVLSARVHVTVHVGSRMAGTGPQAASAAVLIGYRPGATGQAPLFEEDVRKLVANAVDGLGAEQVAVVFTPHRPVHLPRATQLDSTPGPSDLVRMGAVMLAVLTLAAGTVMGLKRKGALGKILAGGKR